GRWAEQAGVAEVEQGGEGGEPDRHAPQREQHYRRSSARAAAVPASCDGSNRRPRAHDFSRRHRSYTPPTPTFPLTIGTNRSGSRVTVSALSTSSVRVKASSIRAVQSLPLRPGWSAIRSGS